MKDLGLLLVIVTALAAGQWWDRRRIRAEFEALGQQVRGLQWLPFAVFTAPPGYRQAWFFSVTSDGPDGRAWRSRVAVRFFAGVEVLAREELGPCTPPLPGVVGTTSSADGEERWRYLATAIGCAIGCLLLVGVPYWNVPSKRLELPGSLYGPGLAAVVIAGGALRLLAPRRWGTSWMLLTASIVTTVAVRIAVDVGRDPTSHNLFPFEIVIAAFVGAAAAGAGIGLGAVVARRR
ncbi:MAG: hypothetical protein JNK78_11575 [Planctomycetes bacterium]|nr:hypothetical protein [Planctomycetota bacterium]